MPAGESKPTRARVHSFRDDALGRDDAVAIAARIRSGEISAAEAATASAVRIREVDPELAALQYDALDESVAELEEGAAADGGEPFAGVPSLLKDNADLAGWPTLHGSRAIEPEPAKRTSAPARQFLELGFTVLGKTTLPEFGLSASTEFVWREPTRNPWNTAHSAGASSGGSAALVAAGAVPVAHANDGGGSIRIPAAACGLVGLKPTRARTLDRPGARSLPVNLVAEGLLSRSVRDTAHHLAGCEKVYRNRRLPEVGLVEAPGERRLRIGMVLQSASSSGTGEDLAPEVVATCEQAAVLLEGLGHEIVPIPLPVGRGFAEDFVLGWGMSAALLSAAALLEHGRHFHPGLLDPFTRGLAAMWSRRALETPGALARMRRVGAVYDDTFSDLDAVLSPTVGLPTPELGFLSPELDFSELLERLTAYAAFTPFNNVGGGPGVSLPFGLLPSGLPGSIHLSAARGDERTLLELAYEIEEAAPFPRIEEEG
ncbi:amidase [Dietzia sp.]|uniref:amidase n=1 Tax=Dietzia sp. TaxID=1871616 RepID=UPI002FDAE285